jgi:hypothetical protein
MKKIVSLCLLFCFIFVGCAQKESLEPTVSEENKERALQHLSLHSPQDDFELLASYCEEGRNYDVVICHSREYDEEIDVHVYNSGDFAGDEYCRYHCYFMAEKAEEYVSGFLPEGNYVVKVGFSELSSCADLVMNYADLNSGASTSPEYANDFKDWITQKNIKGLEIFIFTDSIMDEEEINSIRSAFNNENERGYIYVFVDSAFESTKYEAPLLKLQRENSDLVDKESAAQRYYFNGGMNKEKAE